MNTPLNPLPHEYQPFKVHKKEHYNFPYREIGVKGVGVNHTPMISMDEFIDHSQDDALHVEVCRGMAMTDNYKMGMIYGAVPPHEREAHGGKDGWSQMLHDIEAHDPQGVHRAAIRHIEETLPSDQVLYATYKYAYFALGAIIPWYFALYLKRSDFNKKTSDDHSTFTEEAQLFPGLMAYLETLPMKSIGRVLIFTTYPNAGVVTHRDSVVEEHQDHNINLFFAQGSRPSFVWDEVQKTKTYLQAGARSYFFNNRDYHGVDPEPVFRYTVRVDGTFTDELQEKLGLIDGKTWSDKY